jgi:acid phosphatase/acid phosphatase (class A)
MEQAAQGIGHSNQAMLDVARQLRSGTVEDAAAAGAALHDAGHDLLVSLPAVRDVVELPGSPVTQAMADAVGGAVEVALSGSGELRSGAIADPTSLAARLEAAAKAAAPTAEGIEREAFYQKVRDPSAGLDEAAQVVTAELHDITPAPDAATRAREIEELRTIAASRTPEASARYRTMGKFGDGAIWDEYARVYTSEFGEAAGDRLREVLERVKADTMHETEAIKNQADVPRPFVEYPDLVTEGHRPESLSYPSGHSARAEGASVVLQAFWPEKAQQFQLVSDWAGDSRTYQGVHWPSDVRAGRDIGRQVAERVLAEYRTPTGELVRS